VGGHGSGDWHVDLGIPNGTAVAGFVECAGRERLAAQKSSRGTSLSREDGHGRSLKRRQDREGSDLRIIECEKTSAPQGWGDPRIIGEDVSPPRRADLRTETLCSCVRPSSILLFFI